MILFMKNTGLAVLLILITSTANFAQSFAQASLKEPLVEGKPMNSYAVPHIDSKGKKLKRIGLVLGGSGLLAMAGGVVLLADAGVFSASSYKYNKDSWKNISAKRTIEKYAGYALIDVGTYAIAGGVVLFIIGNKKTRREKAAINFTFTPVSAGMVYSF
jgi:hypothetical protein